MMDLQIIKSFFPTGAALWSLDGTPSGLVDQSGNGNNGSEAGGISSYPKIELLSGNAGYINSLSATQFISIPDSVLLRPSSVTVLLWIERFVSAGVVQYLFTKTRGTGNQFSYAIAVDATGHAQMIVTYNSTPLFVTATGRTIPYSKTLLVGLFDDVSKKASIYVNSILSGISSIAPSGILYNVGSVLRLSGRANGLFPANCIFGVGMVMSGVASSQQIAAYYRAETEPRRSYHLFGACAGAGIQVVNSIRRAA